MFEKIPQNQIKFQVLTYAAVKAKKNEIIKFLLNHGCPPNVGIQDAIRNFLNRNKERPSLLTYSFHSDDIELFNMLMDKGMSIDMENACNLRAMRNLSSDNFKTVISKIGNLSNISIITIMDYLKTDQIILMIESGARINETVIHSDNTEDSILSFAISNNNVRLAKYLLQKGASVNIRCREHMFIKAFGTNDFELIKMIGDKFKNININISEQESLILSAIESNNIKLFVYLIQNFEFNQKVIEITIEKSISKTKNSEIFELLFSKLENVNFRT
ncbi:hypothetical protein TVAG_465210 [Trichomonas vaginalis G3]|uniref:Uncharacterized protein n=1 Tax=Trichomonas vaginalis (strain ATCC PRA-98 / G3) TaxID=412133 RepID=A2DTY6_TRIV3|nr:spectrin binding [Trichomonas vaginalis G3]EAY16133.1 hypothetical protein TVAG_465210 [Trichomonas vaginalis G3]KAI5510450.1 spectrin binding [Trichomonas vaginalis G3]|eukprot:XP_001328356.1 hypothetical protein [Trichomonas vaginalis G3]